MNWPYNPDAERYWQTKDGRRLMPREMTTEHLGNILSMAMRNYQIALLCLALSKPKPKSLRRERVKVASSPEQMRGRLIMRQPILADIEAELLRRQPGLRL